jgi:endonuclease YncB( thermonuclease family)
MAALQALANQLSIGSWVVIRELAARDTDGSLWAEVFSRRWEAPLNLQLVAQGLALASDASPAQSRARSLGLGL